ncbi:MAG: class I SAM-dependent rRNA methyltransferase [Bacilli bacterium]
MKVFLQKNEEIRILEGHPWIFSNEILKFEGSIVSGDICEVYTYDNRFIGMGMLNTSSKIMVRMLSKELVTIDEAFFYNRIMDANNLRIACHLDDCYRVVYSEADYLPGLIVDKYSDTLVIQILSLGMEKRKEWIINSLVKIFNPSCIYERSDMQVRLKEGLLPFKGLLYGKLTNKVETIENGIKMIIDIVDGQKTGYFLDQKQNRRALADYVDNKLVLDCFSHTGGFALHALKYHAKHVTAVDISEKACQDIMTNANLNGFENIDVVCCDVFDYLRDESNHHKFDVIVLDPPAFTKSKDTVKKAYKGYKEINLQALKMIKSGGILFTFSCSMNMTKELFMDMLKEAIHDSKRKVRLLDFRFQSFDHPMLLSCEETTYLKCAVLYVL